jgi:hypothetical protein
MGAGTERAHLGFGRIVASRRAEVVSKSDPDNGATCHGPRGYRLSHGHLVDRVLRVEHKLSK